MQDIKILVLYCTNDISIYIIILNPKMSDYIVTYICVTEKQLALLYHCQYLCIDFKHKGSSQLKNFTLCLFCFTQTR